MTKTKYVCLCSNDNSLKNLKTQHADIIDTRTNNKSETNKRANMTDQLPSKNGEHVIKTLSQ